MFSRILRRFCFALGVLLFLSSCANNSYQLSGGEILRPQPAPEFTLKASDGSDFQLSEQRGKVVLLFFGFTNCPDICPTALSNLAAAYRALGTDAEHVRVVFVTVDPDRDTADRIKLYMNAFSPEFVGLRGSTAELEPIMKAYSVTAEKRDLPGSALSYTVDHSAFVSVIDPQGRLREVLPHDAKVQDIVNDTRYLLQS